VGTHHRTDRAPVRDRPNRGVPEVLVAAVGPRMLRLTARYADAWNRAWFARPAGRYQEASTALDAACAAIGRDPGTLRRTAGVLLGDEPAPGEEPDETLHGSAGQIADGLDAWDAAGSTR